MSCEPTTLKENFAGRQLQLSSCQLEADAMLHADRSPSEPDPESLNIGDLPDELMLKIFSYMTISENVNTLQNVCICWRLLAQHPSVWYDKEYVVRYETSEEEAIKMFRAVPHLRTVIMEKDVSDQVFEVLSECCHDLITLDTYFTQILTYTVAKKLFDGCSKIRTLRISEGGLQEDRRFVDAVGQLSHLRVLQLKLFEDLTHCPIELRVLADNCPHLCELDLGWMYYKIQDAKYFIDAQKHLLKHLVVRWMSLEGRCIVPLLTVCADTLQYLDLMYYEVSDDEAAKSFTALGQLHNLRVLMFSGIYKRVKYVFVLAFRNGSLSKLQELHLRTFSDMEDEILHIISEECPDLREMTLENCKGHTDAAFKTLWKLKNLEILKFSGCKCLRGDAIRYIARLPAVRELHFSDVKFKKLAPGIECILDMSSLQCLYLKSSICWKIPFDRFPGRLINLRKLIFNYCEGDQTILDEMSARMPELEVEGTLGAQLTDGESE